MKSLKAFLNNVSLVWKSHLNKLLLAIMVFFCVIDLNREVSDLYGLVTFIVFILFAAMLRIAVVKQNYIESYKETEYLRSIIIKLKAEIKNLNLKRKKITLSKNRKK